jgi:hypothetical protein
VRDPDEVLATTGGDTALVLLVPQAEPLVGGWRKAPFCRGGMPAHITVLYPIVQERGITEATVRTLGRICGARGDR